MTKETLYEAIGRLIIARSETNDMMEQNRINKKLNKLYDLRYILLEQERCVCTK